MLPDFVCKSDVDKLRNKNKEFREFLSYARALIYLKMLIDNELCVNMPFIYHVLMR